MMKKSVLIAALGLFSLNTMAQDAPKEEGKCSQINVPNRRVSTEK